MNNLNILDRLISVEEMVRHYRTIFDKVKQEKKPVIILRRNRPDIALVDVDWLKETETKLKEYEEERALRLVTEGRRELKTGKAKVLKSITKLMT